MINLNTIGRTHRTILQPFPRKVIEEAVSLELTPDIFASRREVRGFAIDPGNSPGDFDDAFGINNSELCISISDVAALIQVDSEVAKEAEKRGFSRYLGNGWNPMIPEELATWTLSLREGELRPTISVIFPILEDLKLGEPRIELTKIRVSKNFTYGGAEEALFDPTHEYHNELVVLNQMAQKLLDGRKGSFLGNFEIGSYDDEFLHGRYFSYDTHKIVRELMILTNRTILDFLQKNGAPLIYRNHFYLARAYYSTTRDGHCGLGFNDGYLHSTSPLRRKSDLANQWAIHSVLENNPHPNMQDKFDQISDRLNEVSLRLNGQPHRRFYSHEALTRASIAISLGAMGRKVFNKYVQNICKDGLISEDSKEEIILRLKRNELNQYSLYSLLFETINHEDNATKEIRENIISYLRDKLSLTHEVMLILFLKAGIQPVVELRELLQCRPRTIFSATASLVNDGSKVVSNSCKVEVDYNSGGRHQARNKARDEARQLALLDLISRVLGCDVEPISEIIDTHPAQQSVSIRSGNDRVDIGSSKRRQPTPDELHRDIVNMRKKGYYTSALSKALDLLRLQNPDCQITYNTKLHKPEDGFSMAITVRLNGIELNSLGVGKRQYDADQEAAKNILPSLLELASSEIQVAA